LELATETIKNYWTVERTSNNARREAVLGNPAREFVMIPFESKWTRESAATQIERIDLKPGITEYSKFWNHTLHGTLMAMRMHANSPAHFIAGRSPRDRLQMFGEAPGERGEFSRSRIIREEFGQFVSERG